jgi:hypothetical protein
MTRRIIYSILLLLFLADAGFSFIQHYTTPLDGDMAGGIVPANDVKQILDHPVGINVITKNQIYPNPNRFFSHWMFKEYFNRIPLLLQKFVDPIESIYLSCAIAKIIIQISLIFLLAMSISGAKNILKMDFMIAVILVTPLFQTNGYRGYMGIIDLSTTYTFFYALPCALLLSYLSPFVFQFYHNKKFSSQLIIKILWIPLAIVICLSGPLNPGVVLIFSMLVVVKNILNNYTRSGEVGFIKRSVSAIKRIPGSYYFYLLPVSIIAIYSLYIGKYDSYNVAYQTSLVDLYSKLPKGIYYQFMQKMGFPVLFIILMLNYYLISKRYNTLEGGKIKTTFKWIGLFIVCYILLLPFGGYRGYRPNILRYDTIMPVTLSLMFIFGISTLFLIKSLTYRQKLWYLPIIATVIFIFTNSDRAKFDRNKCEKIALKEISESGEKTVKLQGDCTVLSWGKIIKPEDSELNAQLLNIWRVTSEKKLYYNE